MDKIAFSTMCEQISRMAKEELMRHLHKLGCTWSYEQIVAELSCTIDEMSVSDKIFMVCEIRTEDSPYPSEFVDEAVLEICRREPFPFLHYTKFLDQMCALVQEEGIEDAALRQCEALFAQFCAAARRFRIRSLDALLYRVEGSVEFHELCAIVLSEMRRRTLEDVTWQNSLLSICTDVLTTFPASLDVTKEMFLYEQAAVWVLQHSPKGEALFKKLIQTGSDPTEAVLYYALAYLDTDEARALRILRRYDKLLHKESSAYETIRQIQADCTQK